MSKKLIVFFALVKIFSLSAQNVHFEHYGEKDGLSQNSIRDIVQDDKGFLWFATFSGVNKFDGYDFHHYRSDEKGRNYNQTNDIVDMEFDHNQNLWIGSTFGLLKYHIPTETLKKYYHNPDEQGSVSGNEIRSLFIDKTGRVWIGTKHDGICIYNEKEDNFKVLKIKGVENIREIKQMQDGKFWFSTFNKGAYSFEFTDDNKVVNLKKYNFISERKKNVVPEIYFLFEDQKFDVFAGTKDGIFKLDKLKGEFQLLHQKEGLDYFRCITIGPNNHYWIGTLNGLIRAKNIEGIATGDFERFHSKNTELHSLSNNYVLSLLFDTSGVLWIGTENGLDKFDKFDNQFKSISRNFSNSYSFPNISSLVKTSDNKLLIGTHGNGIYLKHGENYKRILPQFDDIASIYTVDHKIFYLGLWDGKIVKYNYLNNSHKVYDVGLKKSPIFSIYKISKNEFFIGSNGEGLLKYNFETNDSRFINQERLGELEINKIVKGDNENYWLASEDGIWKLDENSEEVEVYNSENEKISNNRIKDIIIDKDGTVWAGTRQGLQYYDPSSDSFKDEIEDVDVLKNWVTDIAIDSSGVMWLNMNYNQLGKYNPKSKDFRLFHVNNGIRSNKENKKGFLLFDDTRIFLGGDRELIYFSSTDLKENKIAPSPVISEFKIGNEIVHPGLVINGEVILEEDLNYSKSVDLSYDNRNFSLKFSVPSYLKEDKNKFQYKLEKIDKEWHTVNSDARTVQYGDLFPGRYTLKLKASNNNGYWSEPVSYQINIEPPFWLTYKAFILLIVVVVLVFYFVKQQIKKRLELKHALVLEKVHRERDEKVINEKLRFFTNISHELRTPLTLILGPVKQLLEKNDVSEYDRSRVKLIDQNASRLLQLVNQILDFRRAQTGELKLKVSQTEIVEQTEIIYSSFKHLADEKQISYNFNSEPSKIEGWIDTDKYHKILYNLLSNALKFTKEEGNVDLFVTISEEDPSRLIIEVSDDGIGIPKPSIEKIFNRFYQANNSKDNTTGTGIGLSLVQSLVKIHKGTINVVSEVDKGTQFRIELPIDRDQFSKEEIFEIPLKQIVDRSKNEVGKIKHNTDVKQRVLLIDDNVEVRKFLVDYLSDSYKIYEADNGIEGLKVCRKVKPDLCVVDVMMPEMDGFEFLEELKNDENISNTAVVMLTALSENENKLKGYSIGADGYLVKPFDPSLLKTRIDNILKIRFNLKKQFSGQVESDVTALAHSKIDVELISKLTGVIEENLSNVELSSTFLCEEMAMSSSKLYRKIKQLTDLSPNEFIRTVRLKKSATLLKTREYNVSEVATMVGFNDPLYFSRVFKKQFGYAPSKLLK